MKKEQYNYWHVPLKCHPKNEINVFYDLIKKYKKYGSLYIGVDFDNTLLPYGEKEILKDSDHNQIINLLKWCKEIGFKLCLWSLSTSQENLDWKIQWCKEHGIEMDYINESPLMKEFNNVTNKPHFNLLLDDVAGLESSYSILANLCNYIENINKYVEI